MAGGEGRGRAWWAAWLRRLLGADADWVLGDLQERNAKRRGWARHAGLIRDGVSIGWWAVTRRLQRREVGMAGWRMDAREGLRVLVRRRAYSAGVIATLALGAGTVASAFAVVNAVVLRPLPFPDAGELVRVYATDSGASDRDFTPAQVDALASSPAGRAGLGAFSRAGRTLQVSDGAAYNVGFARVTPGFFATLRVAPRLGRLPDAAELESGAPVVVLSERLWRSRFGSDPGVVGSRVVLDEAAHTVIGVLDRGFPEDAELWRPLTPAERADGDPELVAVARRPRGEPPARLASVLAAAVAAARAADPDSWGERGARAIPLQESLVGTVRGPLWFLMAAAVLVLLVAAGNVAALQLVRGIEGRQEAAIRLALGASKGGVVRRALMEAFILGTLGCAAGASLAALALPSLRDLANGSVPSLTAVTLDARVVAAVGVATLTVTLLGALGAVSATVRRASAGLRGGGGVVTGQVRLGGLRVLIAGQLALTTVLIVTAALLTVSLQRLLTLPRGFDGRDVLAVPLALSPSAVDRAGGLADFERALFDRIGRLPGVGAVAVSSHEPGVGRGLNPSIFGVEVVDAASGAGPFAVQAVSPSFFRTVGLPVFEGSGFPDARGSGAPEAVVVNRSFAREALGAPPWVGRRLARKRPGQAVPSVLEVVGVSEDVVVAPGEAPPTTLYVPTSVLPIFKVLLLRVDGSVKPESVLVSVNAELGRLDPTQPRNVATRLTDDLARTGVRTGFQAKLMALFGLLGLTLAGVGVYGVASYGASQRRAEFGLRIALGASAVDVIRLGVERALGASALGIVLGLIGAWWASLSLRGLLFDVTPFEPAVYLGGAVLLGLLAFSAAVWPAARAASEAGRATSLLRER